MLEKFDYPLPQDLIAHTPVTPRDHSRLMVLDRRGAIAHRHFYDLTTFLDESDVLVLNQTKVFPARLFGNKSTGGKVEILLHQPQVDGTWTALVKPGVKPQTQILFGDSLQAEVVRLADTQVVLKFNQTSDQLQHTVDRIGFTPLPPYIQTTDSNLFRKRYQTIFAKTAGSVAAPTAGLHFTHRLLQTLRQNGVQIQYLTLHVGLGTFKPVSEAQIQTGVLHTEKFELPAQTAQALNQAKTQGKKITAVGTTTTRVLESCSDEMGILNPKTGETNIFIRPSYRFNFVDHLITNFHIPRSSLLMLIAAFTSAPQTKEKFVDFTSGLAGHAYQTAIDEKYRFYSFGDAMLIL